MALNATTARFSDDPILPPDPEGLTVLHEREYRVRAYRIDSGDDGPRLLLRGAVRDQKPAGLYIAADPEPLTFHHMQVELEVDYPDLVISAASVLFEAHPHDICGSIAPHYGSLVGLSITRGFTHEVRQRFGGPRGCTHTTALLLAMAPVAIQSIWSMQIVEDRAAGREWRPPDELSPEQRRQRWAATLNSCHVWDEEGEFAQQALTGGFVDIPIPMRQRLDKLGLDVNPSSVGASERQRTSVQPRPAWPGNAMMTDPFGLEFGVDDVARRPGQKWSSIDGRLAAWVADMDFPVAPAVAERLASRVAIDVGYPRWDDAGRSYLPERFARRMAERYAWMLDESRLHELSDVLQAVALAVHHLSTPGDGVVLHVPAYPPFLQLIRDTGRRLVEVPAIATASGVVWDYDELDQRLADARPRLWILCHPQNPTGRVFDRGELERVAELAAKHDLVVVSDEIHADLVHPGHLHIPFASLGPDVTARTITATSASKAFNLAGLRWAVLHAGPDHFHQTLSTLPSHYLGTPNVLAVEATDAAWSVGDDWLTAVRGVLDDNRRRLTSLLADHLPAVGYHEPEATYLAWLDCRSLGLGDDPAAAFRERGVELASGPRFGSIGAGYARLNFATSPQVLAAVVERMAGRAATGDTA